MKKIAITLAAAALSTASLSLQAQTKLIEKVEPSKNQKFVIPYSKFLLPNGLTVIVHEDHSDPIVHVDVTYHVGSAREEISKSGFAHFFEHMMFQGSDNVADEQHFKIITEAGGTLNGTTNRDRTNYFETVPKNQLEKMLWLEADRMGFLLDAVTQKKFEIQRATVKNERGQNYDNKPYGLVNETTSKALYPFGHPYSWLTIGYIEDLNRVNVDDLKNFFLRWYGPNNATITVGGDVNIAEVLKLVEKYFGSIPRGPEVTNMKPSYPSLKEDRYIEMTDQYAKLPMLRVAYPTPQWFTKEEAALDILADIIGGGNNSIMYQQLVKSQKAIQANAYNSASELAGEFTISVIPSPGKTLKEMDEEIRKVFTAFEARGVQQEDIDKYFAQLESQTIFGLESVSGKVSQLAAYQTFLGDANYIQKYLDNYRSITPKDVMQVYEQFIKNKGAVRLSVMTKENQNSAGNSHFVVDSSHYQKPDYGYAGLKYNKAKDNFDRSKMPVETNDLNIAAPNFWEADKEKIAYIGTVVDEIPVVNIYIKFPGGSLTDQPGKEGTAAIFAAMMEEGTKSKTAEEFSKALDMLGSSISFSANKEEITVMVRSLKRNLDKTLALLEEKLSQPMFDGGDFKRILTQSIEGYKNGLSRPASVASNVLPQLLFGNSLYARSTNGTAQSLGNIGLEDIQHYYEHNFSTLNAKVVVVGDIAQNEIMPKLSFLENQRRNMVQIPPVNVPSGQVANTGKQKIYFINFPGAAQTEFRIATNTGLKYDGMGDYFKSNIMNYPLGGVFNSRLNLYLREEKGWTYGARTGFSGNKFVGYFVFSGGILAKATDSAFYDIMDIMQNYKDKGVQKEELEFTKSAKLQSEARQYETGIQQLSYLSNIQEYDLPKDFASQQTQILKNISTQEINSLAKKYLVNADQYLILLVGDKANLSPKTFEKYDIIYLDKEGNVEK